MGSPRQARAVQSRALAARFEATYALPRWVHVLCVLCLALVAAGRGWPWVSELAEPLGDEVAYFQAFERVQEGDSAYRGTDYLYPPMVASLGAALVDRLGREPTAALLRSANLLGLGLTVWFALAWSSWRVGARLAVGAAVLVLSPQAVDAVRLGNLSMLVCGLTLGSLLLLISRPLPAGALLGIGLVIKPIALGALLSMVGTRRRHGDRNLDLAAVAAVGVVVGLVATWSSGLREFLDFQQAEQIANTVSLHRFPQLWGLELSPFWISGPIALAAVVFLWRHELGWTRWLCFAIVVSLAVTPVVWSHTLLLALPLEAIALAIACDRWRARARSAPESPVPPWAELALVGLAVAALHFATGAGGIDDQVPALQVAATALPALAPAALFLYVYRRTDASLG